MEKKEMASPTHIEWEDAGHIWGLACAHKPEKEFFESILRSKKLFPREENKSKLGNVKRFEKLFTQEGLGPNVKVLVSRELSNKEKEAVNKAMREETLRYPGYKVQGLLGEKNGQLTIDFSHTKIPPRTVQDKINDLIKDTKKKLKKR